MIISVLPFLLGGMMGNPKNAPKKVKIFNAVTGQIEELLKIYKTDEEWKELLTPEEYNVTRLKGTEQPFSGQCAIPKKGKQGLFKCVCCGTDLFLIENEFNSGTGWPSFWEPVSDLNITMRPDNSLMMQRTEVLCSRCDAHLGHVFDDGPAPTGKRYCINAVALKFVELNNPRKEKLEQATFAAGCFWGVEAAFAQVKGVVKTRVGFTGGKTKDPSYEDVSSGLTGHAESVELEFEPSVISYEDLLDIFFKIHDPTTSNKQGPDIGSQYRSVIFYHTPAQKNAAILAKNKLESLVKYKKPIVTEILPAGEFYSANEYHQGYFQKRGIKPTCHIPLSKND